MRTGLRLAVAGLLFRRSTALIVLVLATVASAGAVLAPLYSRAAEESILRDTLRHADPFSLAVHLSVPATAPSGARDDGSGARAAASSTSFILNHRAFGTPRTAYAVTGRFQPTAGEFGGGAVAGQLVDRPDFCAHVTLTAGRCATRAGEALLTRRSMKLLGARIGGTVPFAPEPGAADVAAVSLTVVGTFDPVSVAGPYWSGRPYFSSYYPKGRNRGLGETLPTADPAFAGPGTAARAGVIRFTVDVPVLPANVRLADVPVLRKHLAQLATDAASRGLTLDSEVPAALARADDGRHLVRVAAPLAVAQLVLLSWWALFLVVASATEERSPELGLAKLRGLTRRQTARFGLGEVLLLLLVAAPVGVVLGYAVVRAAASRVFAPGTPVTLTWPTLLTVLGALGGGLVTALLASRQIVRRPVSELLRRVPSQASRRRAGLIEGVVLALTVLGVVQLTSERGSEPSPVALLAPGMVAVAGGLLAARVLVRVARDRSARALEAGRAAPAAGWAAIARRPGTGRLASVLAVATCLLLVGVESWGVAQRNRAERSAAETGAEVVLHVRADPRVLLDTVRSADPSGGYAMAVLQVDAANQDASLLAIDGTRADRVVLWGSPGVRPATSMRRLLLPSLPAPLAVEPGRLTANVDVTKVTSPTPLRLTARLEQRGSAVRVDLGTLSVGAHTYTGVVPPSCGSQCSIAGLAVDHPATDFDAADATLRVTRLTSTPGSGPAVDYSGELANADSWRPGTATVGGPTVAVDAAAGALEVQVHAPGGQFAEVTHGDVPDPLPAVAGPDAQDVDASAGVAAGPAARPLNYEAVAKPAYIPRLGKQAVFADLGLTLRLAQGSGEGEPQVWLSRSNSADERALREKLTEAGIAVLSRESRSALERLYAGNGAVLSLRLLLLAGAAAVLVAVGAVLVAAYIGRRQRAYDVAALRAVGLLPRTVRSLLLRESIGTVYVALACGTATAVVASAVVLPALPQFDQTPSYAHVRHAPDLTSAVIAVGVLGLLLLAVGLAVAALQLRSGRPDRLREGVR